MIFNARPMTPDFMAETTNTKWGEIENQEKWSKQYAFTQCTLIKIT
jgi:hypothetical protein